MIQLNNQNQLENWGEHFLGPDCRITPYYSLKFWCIVHRRVLQTCQSCDINHLLINFDELCERYGYFKSLQSCSDFEDGEIAENHLGITKIPAS